MKVLVTGGAGFIGSNVCRRLTSETRVSEVRVIDDLSAGSRSALDGIDVEFTEASILDTDALREVTDGCDAVVHLAALGSVPRSIANPSTSHEVNATGTVNVLNAAVAASGAHVIVASSSSVYGANLELPKREAMVPMPLSPYAVSKLAAEQYALAYANVYGLPVLPFRFFNVFGPGQLPGHVYAAVVPVFMEAALGGRPLPVNGDGEQSRDFTYVGTVVDAITSALVGCVTSASPVNLAFGTRVTLNELIRELEDMFGRSLPIEHRDPRPGDVRHSQADHDLLEAVLPDLRPVPLRPGLEATYAWMVEHLGLQEGNQA